MKSNNNKPYDITFVIRTIGERPGDWWNINRYSQLRYSGFQEGLKGKKVGYVQFEDLINEVQKGIPAPVHTFDNKTEQFSQTKDAGLHSQVVATEVFEHERIDFQTKRNYIDQCIDYFNDKKEKGEINYFINPLESLYSQDKLWLLDVQNDKPNIPLSPVWHFTKKEELETLLHEKPDNYILKGRLGMAGKGTAKLTEESLAQITDENISHYVIQKDVSPVICELRLVYGPDQEHLGTRAYYDRRAPWEDTTTSSREHRAISYQPTKEILKNSSDIISYSKVEVGSADWLVSLPPNIQPKRNLSDKEIEHLINTYGRLSLAEINGFGTNLGPLVSAYDLNAPVVSRIANKYIQ